MDSSCSVSDSSSFICTLKDQFQIQCDTFKAGRVATFLPAWQRLTNDPQILSVVAGAHIEFASPPNQLQSATRHFSKTECRAITSEITTLLKKGVLEIAKPEQGQVVSPIFLVPKADGSYRMILNLKELNQHVVYHHCKMDTLSTITQIMKENCFMASLDLKDAYYCIPVAPQDRKYLCFQFNKVLYRYTCFPNGLSSCPRIFTKILKPALSTLHKKGHIVTAYLDDIYIQGDTLQACSRAVFDTMPLLTNLGFVIHPAKSAFVPYKELKMLGFILNSEFMTIRPPQDKIDSLIDLCHNVLAKNATTIRTIAKLLGTFISLCPGVQFGPLYFRRLERAKTLSLKMNRGNFEKKMFLAKEERDEILWWMKAIGQSYKPIRQTEPDLVLETDASNSGWGAVCNHETAGGLWSQEEQQFHINYLEMLAILCGLKTLLHDKTSIHVRVLSDNTTAVMVLRNMGTSHSKVCDDMCKLIWEWCIERNIWLSIHHIPGKLNVIADRISREKDLTSSEWKIDPIILNYCFERLSFTPNIDLFASSLNYQLERYVSYQPDTSAYAIDAFSLKWSEYNVYAFPPFSLIPRVLSKIHQDRAEGVCVIPDWPTQPWYPLVAYLLISKPLVLKPTKNLLYLPSKPDTKHPLHSKLQLLVCHLSAKG